MRLFIICLFITITYAVDMPFFFDVTRAPEIFRDQLGMREAMDVWGQMIRKMTNGEKPDNVRQQVLRPKKVDKSVLKSLPKASGEIINERLLNMLLPRVRGETTMTSVNSSLTTSSLPTTTTNLVSTTSSKPPTTLKSVTKQSAKKATRTTTTTLSSVSSTTTTSKPLITSSIMNLPSTDSEAEHKDEVKKPKEKKANKIQELTGSISETNEKVIKSPKLSVRIRTANETQSDTMDSAVMSILMEKIDDMNVKSNETEVVPKKKSTTVVHEYTEEIRSRNVLKEKNLESEELFKDHEASSILLHGAELLENANSSTIADIKQLIEKIEQESTNGTDIIANITSELLSNENENNSSSTSKEMISTDIKKNKTIANVESDEKKHEELESTNAQRTTSEPVSSKTESAPTEITTADSKTETEDENSESEDDVQTTDEAVVENTKNGTEKTQNRIPEAEDESDDQPAFVQSDDGSTQADPETPRQNIDGDAAAGGTVYNIQANANSDSKPVQTSVITPITGILDSIRPLMYYFTRPMQAAGVRNYAPENDPNYYGYQKTASPQQLTLSDLTANIAKRLLGSGNANSEKNRWNPASIQDLQKNILQSYGDNQNTDNQLVPLEKITKLAPRASTRTPQVLTVDGSSQKVETAYYAPVLHTERNTIPIIARPKTTKSKYSEAKKHAPLLVHTTTTTTTTATTTATTENPSESNEELEDFEDDSSAAVSSNFLGDSGVLSGGMKTPQPDFEEPVPFALHPITDEAPYPMTYKTFGSGSFGGGRRPSIPLTEETNSSSDILSFFDSKQR